METRTIQFAQVPVTLGTATEWRTIYFLTLNNVLAGESYLIHGEGQVRNDLGYNIELAQIITAQTSVAGGTEVVSGNPSVISSTPINGWNVDPTMHYGRFLKDMLFCPAQDYPTIYICMRVRCRSSSAGANHAVTVNDGQGMLYLTKLNGV